MKTASSHTKETSASSTLLKKEDQSSFFSYGGIEANGIQAKLSVGQPHDPYEKEADAMADHVVQKLDAEPSTIENRAPNSLQTKPAVSLLSSASPVFTKSATKEHEENLQESDDEKKENVDLKLQRKPIFESNAEPPPPNDDGENNVQCKATDEPSEVDAPGIEKNLSDSKGSGSLLPDDTRTQMESSFGADFSGVRIHDDSSSAQMSKDLQAHAFTHGSDIYFNSGKYDVNSKQGNHLLAHELTHVVQQQGPEVKPRVQGAWYNFSIPFTDYEFDPSIEGIKTAAGLTADAAKWTGGKIKEGAVYVKDKAVEAVEWIYEKIKGLVNAGIDWLTDKFMAVKDFAVSAFDSIKSALAGALDLVKSPMEFLKHAFALMNPGFLGTAWAALKSGARMMWQAVKAATNGVLKIGGGIWKSMAGYVDTLFASVGGLINNWLFRKLPDFMQEAARALYEKVKSLWQTIRDFWMELWERLTKFINDLLKSIESFVERVIAYAIDTVINTVKWLRETYDYIQRFIDDPEGTLKPVVDAMVSKIRTEGPPKGDSIRQEKTAEAYAQSQAKKSGANGTIQRAPAGKVERSTASLDEVGEGLIAEMVNQWNTLDFGKLVWEGLKNAVYPPATIKAIGHEFYELWNTDWANAKNSLFMPRNIFEDFGGFFHDVWSNILILLDFPLALWRRLNNVLMLLMFWITLLLVVAGAVIGGLIAGPPGILLGMKAGLAASFAVGEFLLGSFLLGESITVIKILLELFTARQTQEQKHQDYVQATASFFGIVIALLFMLIFFLVSSIVSAVVSAIKGAFKTPPIKPPVTKPAPPPGPPKPVEPAPPGPANPAKPVEPPKPVEEPVPPKPAEEPVPPKPAEEPVPPKPAEEPVPPKPAEEPVPPKPAEEPPKPGEEPPKPGEEPPKPEEPTGPGYEPWKAKGPAPNPNPGWGKGQIPCFPAGTLVSTPVGKQKIENIKTGDFVLAFDFPSRSVVSKQVVDTYRGSTKAWVNIYTGDSVLKATQNHPVWIVNENKWIQSKDLATGMILLLKNNQQIKIERVEFLELREPAPTFNLSVKAVNNYFAGEEEILVHNDDKTRLNRPGYKNYYLKDSAGNIYYEGMYGPEVTENQVRARHAKNNNRFNPSMGDDMVTLPGSRTYGDARRMEHERCVRNKTYIGRNGNNYRGNRQYPMNEDTFGRYYRTDAC